MARVGSAYPQVRSSLRAGTEDSLVALFQELQPVAADKFNAGAQKLIARNWINKLADKIEERHMTAADAIGSLVADKVGFTEFDAEVMRAWLAINAGFVAQGVADNAELAVRQRNQSKDKPEDENPVDHVFGIMKTSGAALLAVTLTTTAANFAARDSAEKGGAKLKTWHTHSSRSRTSHARMNGQTVGISDRFSNGLSWPGDPDGKPDETAGCHCSVSFVT